MKFFLEAAIAACSVKWDLQDVNPIIYDAFINNYLVTAYSKVYQKKCVLKICVGDSEHRERKALQYFNSRTERSVRLVDYDDQHNALLLEHLSGPSLKTLFPARDDEAIEILIDLVRDIHMDPCTLEQRANFKVSNLDYIQRCLDQPTITKIPRKMLLKAQELYEILIHTQKNLYVLHADLHHSNILWDDIRSSWIAVDPKGILGELEVELTPFIVNPIPDLLEQENALSIIPYRIERCIEAFGLDRQRFYQWLFVLPVHGACWSEEDGHKNIDYFIRFAQLMEQLV